MQPQSAELETVAPSGVRIRDGYAYPSTPTFVDVPLLAIVERSHRRATIAGVHAHLQDLEERTGVRTRFNCTFEARPVVRLSFGELTITVRADSQEAACSEAMSLLAPVVSEWPC